ncbi:c-type cytochrome [Marinobacterium sediminicola]|uniref:Cytochrome c553 n=1 Tax=Marinobacterium sediminicola TaxID=518898 RepID=A0ABY1S3I2_9GAMM|nr:c-type cytochrome [Marinobacterium sediminicola]ULG69311.1 cytochrome c4 [Marinobacterium sediminicola]SMR77662.1 Cytochrome c553 [Marinobacterium sediminicola]
MNKLLISLLVSIGLTGVAHAAGDAAAGQAKTAVCAACHGADGNSVVGNFPKLAGQGEKYLLKQLNDIKGGARMVPEMTGLLNNLSDQDLADIAAYYASKKVQLGQAAADQVELGQRIWRAGVADKGVAACTACHGPAGKGIDSAAYPALSGQHAQYVESTLNKFAKGERDNDPAQMMRDIAGKLSEAEMKAVSQYVQGLH